MKRIYIAVLFHILCVSVFGTGERTPRGWNSFDSYGAYLHEDAAIENLEILAHDYKKFGYEYFVIDIGWYGEFKLQDGSIYPMEKHAHKVNFNEYGLPQPSKTYFPNGFEQLIRRTHELGLKFGLHLMRGIPRSAVAANVPIKGTPYFAQDIADTASICTWNPQNYGVDITKPGAQEFYNSLINQMAEWGVDFIKYDDIVHKPLEVMAVIKAIAQCGKPIVLSLSPGDKADINNLTVFKHADMLRVTGDVWDNKKDIDKCFKAWHKWEKHGDHGFCIDMDMIPFGELQVMKPKSEDASSDFNTQLLAGHGFHRICQLNKAQQRTFITLRALSRSPLMIGGRLASMDKYSYKLLTDKDVLSANENTKPAKFVGKLGACELWFMLSDTEKGGWIGIFNRGGEVSEIQLKEILLNCNIVDSVESYSIWDNKKMPANDKCIVSPDDVLFLNLKF